MTFADADVESTYDTLDEAIAAALESIEDGDIVQVHALECEMEGDDESTCSCHPMTLRKGAQA